MFDAVIAKAALSSSMKSETVDLYFINLSMYLPMPKRCIGVTYGVKKGNIHFLESLGDNKYVTYEKKFKILEKILNNFVGHLEF